MAFLDEVEVFLGTEIELGADHYWMIEAGDAFQSNSVPVAVVGQLADDVGSLREAIARETVVLWHDLEHLSGILRRLADIDRTQHM